MLRIMFPAIAIVAVLLFAACSSSNGSGSNTATHSPTPISAGNGNAAGSPDTAGNSTPESADGGGTSPSPGVSATGAANAGTADPCSLLTQAEVSAALGEAVDGGALSDSDPHECIWTATESLTTALIGTNIALSSFQHDEDTGSSNGISVTKVSGVGDDAYYLGAAALQTLYFRNGDRVFSTHVSASLTQAADAVEAAEKQLAIDALARIS